MIGWLLINDGIAYAFKFHCISLATPGLEPESLHWKVKDTLDPGIMEQRKRSVINIKNQNFQDS